MDYSGIINIWLDNNKDFITRKLKKYNNKLLKVQKRTTQIKKIFSDLRTIDPVLYKKIQSGGGYFDGVSQKLEEMGQEIKDRDINVGDLTSKVSELIKKINTPNIDNYSDNLVATANIVSQNPETQQYNIHRQLHTFQHKQPPNENITKYEEIINDLYKQYIAITIPDNDEAFQQFTTDVSTLIKKYSDHTKILNADLSRLKEINNNLLSITTPNIQETDLKTITEGDLKKIMSKILLVGTEDNFLYSQSETKRLSELNYNIFEKVINDNKQLQLKNLETEYTNARESLSGGLNYSDLFNKFLSLHTVKNKLQTTYDEYKQECDKYIDNYNSIYAFVTFLITNIINNMLKDKISKYKYLNRNIIVLYKKRLEKLKNTIENANTSELLTVKHQYSFVINFTFGVFNWLLNEQNKITDTNFVDVEKCEGDLRRGLWYFEFFRPTLDYLYSKYQQKVNLYARINNISKPGETIQKKYFTKQGDDVLQYSGQNMKFSMVFDQSSLLSLSDSMSLPSDLALKKSVMLLTSGYSGTGKTYTLFGKDQTAGILHETLKNISRLKQLYFRVFEIYGLAVPYSFYFDKGIENISNNIFWHSIDNDNHSKIDEVVIEAKDITDFLKKKTSDTHSVINPHPHVVSAAAVDDTTTHRCFTQITDVDKFFNSFKDIITTKIDNKRKYNSYDGPRSQKEDEAFDPRICATPNNPESSRSILVYDFRLMISNDDDKEKTDEVKLLVVDMPGRENIYKTYVESYVDNPYLTKVAFKDKNQKKKIKMILSFISLHPLFMGFFNGKEVLDCYNKLSEEEQQPIFNHYQKDPTQPAAAKNILDYEINNKAENNTLREWFSKYDNQKIKLNLTREQLSTNGFNYLLEEQYHSLIALFIMYNLIMLNKFDIIKKIIKKIVATEINHLIDKIILAPTSEELQTLKQKNLITRTFELPPSQQGFSQDLSDLKKQLRCNIALKAQQACSINENVMATYLTALNSMTSSKKTIYEEQPKIDINKERNVYRIQSQCSKDITNYPNDERTISSKNFSNWINKIKEIYANINFDDYQFEQHQEEQQRDNLDNNTFKKKYRTYPLRKCDSNDYWYDLFDEHITFLSKKYYSPNKIFNITTPVMKTIIESIFMPNTSEIVQASAQASAQAQAQIPTETPWECKIVHILANFHDSVKYDNAGQVDLLTQIRELANIIG